jgi:hypothetical protein
VAHWKKKEQLLELVQQLHTEDEYATCPQSSRAAPCPPALSVSADTEERVVAVLERLVAESRGGGAYVQTRRTMPVEEAWVWSGAPPETGPPLLPAVF